MKAAEVARRVTATYFFKGGASAKEDVGYSLDRPWLRQFMAGLTMDGFEIGLHPSYAAYDHPGLLRKELGVLTKAIGRPPRSIRTHFLRWADPSTPRMLDREGFQIDSTLGFSKHEGFRRATCHPFRLFDIHQNRPLDMWEVPLAVMDASLFSHRRLSPEEASEQIQAVFEAAKRVGGCAVLLWHNTLYDEVTFPGQGDLFEQTLDRALADGAFVGSLQDVIT
ncbi:MAG: polysaccharide deacetylase family protein [Bacteroidetes bacterium]|nr:polysaccharide deacetylase family protein [Bacteroidota bacterium]